jgi:hypothetical protein
LIESSRPVQLRLSRPTGRIGACVHRNKCSAYLNTSRTKRTARSEYRNPSNAFFFDRIISPSAVAYISLRPQAEMELGFNEDNVLHIPTRLYLEGLQNRSTGTPPSLYFSICLLKSNLLANYPAQFNCMYLTQPIG